MAEPHRAERLQPSLLDRLVDEEPLTRERLRRYVRRDLGWLLNTTQMSSARDLSEYPNIERSVLNYGVPDYAGRCRSHFNESGGSRTLTDAIAHAIREFEPRLKAVAVTLHEDGDDSEGGQNSLILSIEGELWGRPLPLHMLLRTELDLEDGNVELAEPADSTGNR